MLHCCLPSECGTVPRARPRPVLLPVLSTLKLPFFYTLVDSGSHLWQQPRPIAHSPQPTDTLLVALASALVAPYCHSCCCCCSCCSSCCSPERVCRIFRVIYILITALSTQHTHSHTHTRVQAGKQLDSVTCATTEIMQTPTTATIKATTTATLPSSCV